MSWLVGTQAHRKGQHERVKGNPAGKMWMHHQWCFALPLFLLLVHQALMTQETLRWCLALLALVLCQPLPAVAAAAVAPAALTPVPVPAQTFGAHAPGTAAPAQAWPPPGLAVQHGSAGLVPRYPWHQKLRAAGLSKRAHSHWQVHSEPQCVGRSEGGLPPGVSEQLACDKDSATSWVRGIWHGRET